MSGSKLGEGVSKSMIGEESLRLSLSDKRVIVLVQGNSKGLQGVKYRAAFEALKAYVPALELWDIDVTGWRRTMCIARSFKVDRTRWRETFYSHPVTFDAYGAAFARRLRRRKEPVDAFVTFGVKFDAARYSCGVPVMSYTDYTTALTERNASGFRHPLKGALSKRRIAQERAAMAGLSAICTRSQYVADAIVRDYGIDGDRVTVVGGGSNLALAPKPPKIPEDESVRFLFVGKAFARKGGDIALAAFDQLRVHFPTAELSLVTKGAPETLPSGVRVYSAPSSDTYADLFRTSNVFVLASRFETWGDVMIEAMSQGMPCICPDRRPLDEVVEDGVNGRLFRPEDSESLCRAMEELCADPALRRHMARNAFETSQTRLNWQVVGGKLAAVVERII